MRPFLLVLATGAALVATAGWAADEADEKELTKQVVDLIHQGQLDAAAAKLDAALTALPDSVMLNAERSVLAKRLERAGRPADALRQITALLDYTLRTAARQPRMRAVMSRYLFELRVLGQKAKQPEAAERTIEDLIQKAASLPDQAILQGLLRAQKAMALAEHGKTEQAAALASQLVAQAQAAWQANPDDVSALVRLINMQKTQVDVLQTRHRQDAERARQRLLALLAAQAPRHKDQPDVVKAYLFELVAEAGRLSRNQPDRAQEVITTLNRYIGTLDRRNAKIRSTVARAKHALEAVEREVATALARRALIGTPAALPQQVDAWINGEAVSAAQLKDKVVVLHFWAVWSRPCIEALPCLRTWHQRYAERGLVILALTRYSHFDWDDQRQRVRPQPGLPPEQERQALARFAKYHRLPYRVAVLGDGALVQHYVANAVPETVVIDRGGKVRMIRTGSNRRQMEALEAMIQQCLEAGATQSGTK